MKSKWYLSLMVWMSVDFL
uniref:Uncharacterized protein n=1 Tax=Anguilla anguilla TaxID=7936 RepID=A0A0E9XZY7_ANGAN